jgi:hypothetical protein
MNIKATVLTLAATAFAFAPKPAMAGDKEAALIGGLIGGAIIGAAIADSHDHDRTVVVSAGYGYDRRRDRDDGYWKTVEVRTWVPGYWVSERRHGRVYRHYVEGHYEFRTDRVWVAYDRHDRYDRRGYGYDRGYRR